MKREENINRNFENDSSLYRLGCELSKRIHYNNRDFLQGDIIFLAFPTYMISYLSKCPITPLDGEDLLAEVEADLTRVHRIYDYNKNQIFNKWKSPFNMGENIREIIPLTLESGEILKNEGFIKKTYSHFPYLNYFSVFIGDKI